MEESAEIIDAEGADLTIEDCRREVDELINEFGFDDNEEQERSFRIITDHFLDQSVQPLHMFMTGIGGSGKSYVIKALVEFFRRCGASQQLLLSAPTGSAAVLIDGYTIHALTFLPKS
ncbi:hypothetical protein BJ138DRAFT_1017420, partial [Hygrophoropsis aurantiaca]